MMIGFFIYPINLFSTKKCFFYGQFMDLHLPSSVLTTLKWQKVELGWHRNQLLKRSFFHIRALPREIFLVLEMFRNSIPFKQTGLMGTGIPRTLSNDLLFMCRSTRDDKIQSPLVRKYAHLITQLN